MSCLKEEIASNFYCYSTEKMSSCILLFLAEDMLYLYDVSLSVSIQFEKNDKMIYPYNECPHQIHILSQQNQCSAEIEKFWSFEMITKQTNKKIILQTCTI